MKLRERKHRSLRLICEGLKEAVDINGNMGYLRRYSLDTAYGDDIYTELIWFSDGTRYAVLGFIIEKDAAKTARSMK